VALCCELHRRLLHRVMVLLIQLVCYSTSTYAVEHPAAAACECCCCASHTWQRLDPRPGLSSIVEPPELGRVKFKECSAGNGQQEADTPVLSAGAVGASAPASCIALAVMSHKTRIVPTKHEDHAGCCPHTNRVSGLFS
jgi:hypothetical protein